VGTHAVVTVDTDGVVTGWDDGADTLMGHLARDAIGRRVDFIVPGPLRAAHWAGFEGAMRQPKVKDMGADLPVLCADGTVREFAGPLLVLSDGLGVAIGAMAIYTDSGTTGLHPFS
jgi:PAS domain S-box-containing protein